MVNPIYPPELQVNKADTPDTGTAFSDLHLSLSNGFVQTKINDKCNNFDFDIVNIHFLVVMFPVVPLMGVTLHNLLVFLDLRVCSHVTHFNARNKSLSA